MSRNISETTVTKQSYFSDTVYLLTPSFDAIKPYVRLFNVVKSEHTRDSNIARSNSFQKYMLKKYYAFVHLARGCIMNNKLLRDCKIIPLRYTNEYNGVNQPFWFPIEHTRFDKAKHTEKEICDNFWKCFGGFGIKLVHLGMSFEQIRNNINRIIENEVSYNVKVRVTTGDVVLSCKNMLGKMRPGWYGRSNWEDISTKQFVGSVNRSVYNRPKLSDEQYKNHVLKRFSRKIVETTRYQTKPSRSSNNNYNKR